MWAKDTDKLFYKKYKILSDPRWWQTRWMLPSPPPRTKLELQLKYRTINLSNHPKTSWIEDLQPRIYRICHIKTGRKGRDARKSSSWDSGEISQLQNFLLKSVGSQPHTRFPSPAPELEKRHPYNIWLWKSVAIVSARERQESGREKGTFQKGQWTKFHSQPLTFCSRKGRVGQTEALWKETGVCGSGEKVEGTAIRAPVLHNSPAPQTPFFLGGALPSLWHQPGGI